MSALSERGVIAPPAVEVPFRSNSWRGKETVEIPHLPTERLVHHMDSSIATILGLQDLVTGLTAAATEERRDDEHHMGHWWMRDQAIKVLALSNGARELTEEGSNEREAIDHFVQGSINGMLDLLRRDEWQEGFGMEVQTNPHTNIRELVNSKKAPPIHARTNGDLDPEHAGEESWVAQNQPDAWGFLFMAIAQSAKNGIVTLNEDQRELLHQAVDYLERIQPENLRQTSMWEWTEPGKSPTSSVAIVRKGFSEILPLIDDPELKNRVRRRIEKCRNYVDQEYPHDYTAEVDHPDPIDLATLVALAHGALEGNSYSKYLVGAMKVHMGHDKPGMIRYFGDQYHMNWEEKASGGNGEAVWFMGLPYRASILFKIGERLLDNGQYETAKRVYAKGAQDMNRALDIIEEHGYPPELFEYRDGEYVVPQDGSSSHIGWNDAVIIQASASALRLKSRLGIED